MTPSLVNGLDGVCTWHQSGCHAENLLLQVWASLYRFKGSVKTVEFRSYKAKQLAKESGAKTIEVGTGNSSLSQLALYQKCGFRMRSIEPNFFDSYPEPIIENGIRCIDMVRLSAES